MNGFADQGLNEDDFGESSNIISTFDAFPKTKRTYLQPTQHGILWTIGLAVFSLWLISSEFWRWMEGVTTHNFSVEKGVAHDLQINLDIVLRMSCADLRVNIMDASGDRIFAGEEFKMDPTVWSIWNQGLKRSIFGNKVRKNEPPTIFSDSMKQYEQMNKEDVHDALRKARGERAFSRTPRLGWNQEPDSCRIYGSVETNKVMGDLHITARGHGYMEPGQQHLEHSAFNFSHHINELSFGKYFPDMSQPLDDSVATTDYHFFKYQYFVSIVPTIYTDAPHTITTSTPPRVLYARRRRERERKRQREQQQREEEIARIKEQYKDHPDIAPIPPPPPSRREGLRGQLDAMQDIAPAEPDVGRDRRAGNNLFKPLALMPRTIYTNQYAVTQQSHSIGERAVPGIFIKYDIEPILLTVAEEWGGFLALFVRCVNVAAGVLVAGGWIVAVLEWSSERRTRRRNISLGSGGGLIAGFGIGSEKKGLD